MKYLVPYDFTPVTRSALDHALALAKSVPGELELLHLISDESERATAEESFARLLTELGDPKRKYITTKVRPGNIFKDISYEAEEGNADLMVMGTHGAKGLQNLLGSYAMKVITSSSTPFIVTQRKGPESSIKRIVLPVNLSRESIQVVKFASNLAKKFKAEIHLVCKPEKDEFLVNRLRTNIVKAKRHFKAEGIANVVSTLRGKRALHKEVIDYGAKYRADLFAIAHYTESVLPQFDKFSQEIITNHLEVPVLIVNAQEVAKVKTAYSFIGI